MCGIAGFVTRAPGASPDSVLARMTDIIRHRGPDGSGYYRDPFASLGHRRLSIIDVAGGHQPMSNEDGALWIVYNGEIFNHADLRPALEQAGHQYRTRCDTETILHAYEQYGPDSVTRFRGMFSFAIWNKDTRTLFCARDRLGDSDDCSFAISSAGWPDGGFAAERSHRAAAAHACRLFVFTRPLACQHQHDHLSHHRREERHHLFCARPDRWRGERVES